LLAYYCRQRHNDWSAAWIREHLTSAKPALYPTWVDDLVTLCRSHHEGLERLQQPRFNARLHGQPEQRVNLRYLAALLRVADVMEFDPERTPEVIIAHRNIAPKSRIYWHKDRFSFVVDRGKCEFRLDATTPDATVHRAILETVQAVDQELLTCSALDSSGAFDLGSFKDERCHWPWPAKVNAKVTENGTFVYIDGAFRPEPQHILKLLGGVELYQDPLTAVRELLQNAFDAVKEQIARERLRRDNPADRTWEQKLGDLHKVRLSLVKDGDSAWLVCDDDGVGMTRAIIERHLLVSGASALPEIHELERDANVQGFSLERSGEFGIGILSYFMISDRMIIKTRRSDIAGGDPDNTGWTFSTEGLGSFGQLTKAPHPVSGTQVRLHLKTPYDGDVSKFWAQMRSYVSTLLSYLPCDFELCWERIASLSLRRGWCRDPHNFTHSLLHRLKPRIPDTRGELLPAHELTKREELSSRWARVHATAGRCMRLTQSIAGDLPAKMGRYRVHLYHFDLQGDACLAFMDFNSEGAHLLPDSTHFTIGEVVIFNSRSGFYLRAIHRMTQNMPAISLLFEIDWLCGKIDVARKNLQIDNDSVNINSLLRNAAKKLCTDFLSRYESSKFASLNRALILAAFGQQEFAVPSTFFAPTLHCDDEKFGWSSVKFPAVELISGRLPTTPSKMTWCGTNVSIVCQLQKRSRDYVSAFQLVPCDRIVMTKVYGFQVLPLWERLPAPWNRGIPWLTKFPPEWKSICVIVCGIWSFWNREHFLVKGLSETDWEWERAHGAETVMEIANELLAVRSRAAVWVVANLQRGEGYWNGIRDQRPDLFARLVSMVMDAKEDAEEAREIYAVLYSRGVSGWSESVALSENGMVRTRASSRAAADGLKVGESVTAALPCNAEWWIEGEDGKEVLGHFSN
jgi:hypothetical protein